MIDRFGERVRNRIDVGERQLWADAKAQTPWHLQTRQTLCFPLPL